MKTRTGYLIRRNKTFYACWTVAGKKFMKTTHKTDRRQAKTELARIMQPFLVEDEVRTLENIKARIDGAKSQLAALDAVRNPPLLVVRAWQAYVDAQGRPDSGERTMSDYAGYYSAFSDWLTLTHSDATALQDVTPAIAGEYTAHLTRERGLSANSFNKHVRFLELLFRVLKEPARLTANPWEAIQRKRVVNESRRELTMDELKTVCTAATGEMRLLFALGIYTGLRLGDATTLRWAEVDLHRGMIRRVPSKVARRNPRPVVIPIHPTLAAMLAAVPASKRGQYVLPAFAALYLQNASSASKLIHDHFEACGVKTQREGTGFIVTKDEDGKKHRASTGKRAVVEVGFHSLRHTFVSMCRESNAPLAVVEAIVGHSNPAMTRHYTHVSELAAAHAVNGLPAIMGDAVKALPAADPLAAMRTSVRALADNLNGKNWKNIRTELLKLVA